jgi:hypothetical protein
MWAGVSVFLSPNLKVGLEEQVREALTINGASISHKFRPGKDIYILEKFDSDGEFLQLHKTLKNLNQPHYVLGNI